MLKHEAGWSYVTDDASSSMKTAIMRQLLMLKHEAGWSYVTDETVEDNKIIRFFLFSNDLGLNRTDFLRGSNRLWWWIETISVWIEMTWIETTVNHGRVMHGSGAY